MSVFTRTVKPDLTVRVRGADFEPRDQHSADLMKRWIGQRVEVGEYNYWGTEMVASTRLPAFDVMHQATLTMVNDRETLLEGYDDDATAPDESGKEGE